MRYFIKFSYNGTKYHGWQIQPNAISVQEILTRSLSVILNEQIVLTGAGRTDSGVHAKEMYAHFDADSKIEIPVIIHKVNSFLPKDVVVLDFYLVADDAHARFDAKKRTYQYYINTVKNPFLQDQSWFYHSKLDVNLMNEAAKLLHNHIDFKSFSKSNTDVNTHNCTIFKAIWIIEDNQLIFTITADRFLRNMVRSIVGTLILIGLHKISLIDFNAIIESKNRTEAGFSVPAHGLYLTKIEYDFINQ